MTTECKQIDLVINLAEKMGNSLFFIPDDRDGNGRLVIWMSDPLTEDLKRKVNLENLKYNN